VTGSENSDGETEMGRSARPDLPPAIVLHMGLSGLEIARSLGRHGVHILGLDSDPSALGFASRFCDSRICPSPRYDPGGLVQFLLCLCARLGIQPVVLPASDENVLFLSRYRDVLEDAMRFALPDGALVESLVSKIGLQTAVPKYGIEMPVTLPVQSAKEMKEGVSRIGFPCLVKPAFSQDWQNTDHFAACKAVEVHNRAELDSVYRAAKAVGPVVLQEIIPGPVRNSHYVSCYLDAASVPKGVFVHRKLRCHPAPYGVGCFLESVREPALVELSIRLLQGLQYHGLAGLDFKRDPRDGSWKLIEVNARFGIGDSLAAICGVDLAALCYSDMAIPVATAPPPLAYRCGVRWVWLETDVQAFLRERMMGSLTFRQWIGSLRQRPCFHSTFAWDDPVPGIMVAGRLARAAAKRIAGRLRTWSPAKRAGPADVTDLARPGEWAEHVD